MDQFLKIILLLAAIYLIMRYGCSALMSHGKKRNHFDDDVSDEKRIDPVCGMQVDINQSYSNIHEGHIYHFCSEGCVDKFKADPNEYITRGTL